MEIYASKGNNLLYVSGSREIIARPLSHISKGRELTERGREKEETRKSYYKITICPMMKPRKKMKSFPVGLASLHHRLVKHSTLLLSQQSKALVQAGLEEESSPSRSQSILV